MNDPQLLIENIRTAISFSETVSPDSLQQYASDYAEACTDLNRRIQQCLPHIRKGNVVEAVRLAEVPPNIPELYSLLDFPERDEWLDIVSTFGYEVAPPLNQENFSELNDAYLKFSPLEPLYRLHRLHSLNGSPLSVRLPILRSLAKADIENMFWSEDVDQFEKARLAELDQEVKKALAENNTKNIYTLSRELTDPEWKATVPQNLIQSLADRVLQGYAAELNQYFNAFDYSSAKETYGKIRAMVGTRNITLSSAIEQSIRPAVQWMQNEALQAERQNAFQSARYNLESALSDGSTERDELDRLYYELSSSAAAVSLAVPAELEQLYRDHVDQMDRRNASRMRLIILSVICVSMLVAGIVGFGIFQRIHHSRVTSILTQLAFHETQTPFDREAADLLIQKIEKEMPKQAVVPAVTEKIVQIKTKISTDQARADDFMRLYNLALMALQETPPPDLEKLGQIAVQVEQAEKLKSTETEQNQYNEIKRTYDSALAARTREIDTKFTAELETLRNELDALRRFSGTREEKSNKIKEIDRKCTLLIKRDKVSSDLIRLAKDLGRSIDQEQKKNQSEINQQNDYDKLYTHVGNWTSYTTALKTFLSKYPENPIGNDFKEVIKESDAVKAATTNLIAMNTLYGKAARSFDSLQRESKKLYQSYETACNQMDESSVRTLFPPGPSLPLVAQTRTAGQVKLPETERFLTRLNSRELFPCQDKDGNWYYLTSPPRVQERNTYVTSYFTEEKRAPKSLENSFKSEKINTHFQFALDALKRLDQVNGNILDIGTELIAKLFSEEANDYDPIVKCQLLHYLILELSDLDPFFAARLEDMLDIIKKSRVNLTTNEMDVDDKSTITQRNLAQATLVRIANTPQLAKATLVERQKFQSLLLQQSPNLEWVGILIQQQGEWTCAGKLNSLTGELYVFRGIADAKIQAVQIGEIKKGKVKFARNDRAMIHGRPVFCKQSKK